MTMPFRVTASVVHLAHRFRSLEKFLVFFKTDSTVKEFVAVWRSWLNKFTLAEN